MKRTDRLTNLIAAVLFIGMLCYIGFYGLNSLKNRLQTTEAITATLRDSIGISGIIVRDESYVIGTSANISVVARDGKRVSKDQTIAIAYADESGLQRAARITELELEIEQMDLLLSEISTAQDVTRREDSLRSAVISLTSSIARQDFGSIDENALRFGSLVLESKVTTASYGNLRAMENELNALISGSSSGTFKVTAPESGVFSSILDGYEHLSLAELTGVTPDSFRAMLDDRHEVPADALGKLITSTRWYLAALVSERDAAALETGGTVRLLFGHYLRDTLDAVIVSVGAASDGECTVVLSCNSFLAETLPIRHVTAELVLMENSGILIPKEAVHSKSGDENAAAWRDMDPENIDTFVFTLKGPVIEEKKVRIIAETEDFYLAAQPVGEDSLREGNEIIVTGKDLYDNKVVR